MLIAFGLAAASLVLLIVAMQFWRSADQRAAGEAWIRLLKEADQPQKVFDPQMVRNLPEAARRYFLFTIAPGTPLHLVSEIDMEGEIGLGDRKSPRYQPMRARQLLAPPHGFVWRLEAAGSGAMRMRGSDAMVRDQSWTRFWLNGIVPLVRGGGDGNHLRSSLGRVVAEAVFWAPATLLPQNGVEWSEASTPRRAKAVVTRQGLSQSLEMEVAEDGRPLWVVIPRWSNVNPQKEWRLQSFGGTLDDFRVFGGFTLPTRVDGGNHFGTEQYFPFFRARVTDIRFPVMQ